MPETKNTFDSISTKYDLINNLISLGGHKRWKHKFVNLLEINGRVLDIATGTGDIAILIKKMHLRTSVVGIDPSHEMLEIAKNKSPKEISYVQGFCEDLPFEDGAFNYITISFGIRNVVSIEKSLNEINRALSEDGHLLIMEFSKNRSLFIKFLYKVYLNFFIPMVGFLFGKYQEYKYLASSIESFFTMDEMNNIISNHGFKITKNLKFNFGLVTVYVAKKTKAWMCLTFHLDKLWQSKGLDNNGVQLK